MNACLEEIHKIGIVPVVVLDDVKAAEGLAEALINGGIPCAEVTFRTAAAEESIRIMTEKYPDMLVGAGTVLTEEQVEKAIAAGARFIVSPGLDEDIVKKCIEKEIPVVPGIATASEAGRAVRLGLEVVKFFPAEQEGGLAKIKALAAPFTSLSFMPTGGIGLNNLNEYLSCQKVIACGGSWMVKKEWIANGEFGKITDCCREAAAKAAKIREENL